MSDQKTAYASKTFKRDKFAWGALILFALIFFWATESIREVDPVELRSWKGPVSSQATLTVLEFDRVVWGENEDPVHQEQLRHQLTALAQSGFEAVSVNDVFNFYYKDGKLPEKSLLLIFANGYLETFSVVDPVLREIKWPATVALITDAIDQRETFFLYWDRLRRMVDSGIWSIVSAGHRSREVMTDAENQVVGRYLTHKAWIEEGGREESDHEYSARVLQDYKISRDMIAENISGYKILAYSSLYRELSKQNDQALKQFFQLGFVDSFVGVNDIRSDPFRLRRLRVQPGWQPETLLALTNKAIQTTAVLKQKATQEDSVWFTGKGERVDTSGHSIKLSGQELSLVHDPGTKPEAHLRGSPGTVIFKPGRSQADNWTLNANIRLDRGEFWVRQNSRRQGDEWRLGGNEDNIHLQYRMDNNRYENLASTGPGIPFGIWHHLRLIKRGKGVIVNWEGKPLWELPVYLQGRLNGDIEIRVWSKDGQGALGLSDAEVSFFPHDIRWLEKYPEENDIQNLIKLSEKVSGVTTVTHLVQGDQFLMVPFDRDLFQIISHRYGWDFIPTVKLLPGKKFNPDSENEGAETGQREEVITLWMSAIQTLVEHNRWTHVHLDLSQWEMRANSEWFPSFSAFEAKLDKMDCRLLITTEGRPDIHQPIKSHQLLKERMPESGWI
ncbi:MAG: hypothetical protein NPINA01_22370 [Nitrospinaceae bacterium]|nr:MAG: hypothetical protein NPINA01_22370 [Nitrospinaceae bacterium]